MPKRKVEAVASKQLPSEIAADAKAADVAEELKLPSWREFVSHAQSDERVDPFERAGSRDSAGTRPLQAKLAEINGGVDR